MILIQNGRLWNGEAFETADILSEKGIITAIGQDLTCEKAYVYDAKGKLVTPGLVDCHMHFAGISRPSYAIDPAVCFAFGVTAAADAGSSLGSFVTLARFPVKNAVFSESVIRDDQLDETATRRLIAQYGSRCVGIKLFYDANSPKVRTIRPLQQVCRLAGRLGLKVLVHCNHSPTSMLSIVETLAPGDILSHVFHGGGNSCPEDDYAAFRLARQKGVVLDAAFAGHVHTDFAILRKAFADGWYPDTISTDLTKSSAFKRGGRYGLTMAMSMARTAGMGEADILRAVTTAPAGALGQSWGRLTVGGTADIAVLDYTDEPYSLTDHAGNVLEDTQGYRCKLTVADGIVVYRD